MPKITFARALFFSSLFHLLLLGWLKSQKNSSVVTQTKSKTKITTLSEKDLSQELKKVFDELEGKKQIVQIDDKIASERPLPTKEKVYLSKKNQYARKNQRAAASGVFKNIYKKKQNRSAYKKLFKSAMEIDLNKAKGEQLTSKKEEKASNAQVSQSSDYLPDVAVSSHTLLNTREYKYYSFYERVRQVLYQHWRSNLNEGIEKLQKRGQFIQGLSVTELEVLITPEGKIQQINTVSNSGIKEFDLAALKAFKESAPFANPPRLNNTRGPASLFPLKWTFVVDAAKTQGLNIKIKHNYNGLR